MIKGGSSASIDIELLGRLVGGLEESSRALKTIQSQQATQQGYIASLHAKVDSLAARVMGLEYKVDGNGGNGLRTEVALVAQDVRALTASLSKMQEWRESMGDRKVQTLEQEKRGRVGQLLAVGALLVGLGSMIANCGPGWMKALAPDTAATTKVRD